MPYALLIDDDAALLASLKAAAEIRGLELQTASSWEQGLAEYQIHAPALVIADYNLPGSLFGLTLLAQIRQLNPVVRLVLLSAYIDDADIPEVEALGLVDRAISKVASGGVTDTIMIEVADAQTRANVPTDWVAYADRHQSARTITEADVASLDARLRERRGL